MKISHPLLLSAGILTLVSCSAPPTQSGIVSINPTTSLTQPEKPVPQKDKLSGQVLKSLAQHINELPNDGRFGLSRVLTFHGDTAFFQKKDNEEAYKAFEDLYKTDLVTLVSWGSFEKNRLPQRKSRITANIESDLKPPITTFSLDQRRKMDAALDAQATEFYASSENHRIVTIDENLDYIVEMQKVYSTSEKCIKCHQDVKQGQPIGVIGVARVPHSNPSPTTSAPN